VWARCFRRNTTPPKRRLVFGKHSDRALVKPVLAERGLNVEDSLLSRCLAVVRSESIRTEGAVEPERVLSIYKELRSELALT
jgi:hypothetical protein